MDTTETGYEPPSGPAGDAEEIWALVLLAGEPGRAGELIPLPGPRVVGRGVDPVDGVPAATLCRQLAAGNHDTGPLRVPRVSRVQLRAEPIAGGVRIHNLGRSPFYVDGRPTQVADLAPGDLVDVGGCVFLCARRPSRIRPFPPGIPLPRHRFGWPDANGIVGESPAIWSVRERVAATAPRAGHVLVTGPSGAGKELVARALHAGSDRARRPLVARNAATLPPSLVTAELFGHARGYPNAGMEPREGLIGEADGSTLFLDEVGELPEEAQAQLLRVLDGGEYHRLGEAKPRRADVRVIAATNRDLGALKHDLRARFVHTLVVPGLEARREDVPLLLRHLVHAIGQEDPTVARFLDGDEPRVHPRLLAQLVARAWTGHARELRALLWESVARSPGDRLEPLPSGEIPPEATSEAERIQAVLDRHGGNQTAAAHALGLTSRHALARLIRKHDLVVRRHPGRTDG